MTVQLVFGTGSILENGGGAESQNETLSVLRDAGVETIDTAYLYGDSEKTLGENGAAEMYAPDTKYPGPYAPGGPSTVQGIVAVADGSLERLRTDQVCISLESYVPGRGLMLMTGGCVLPSWTRQACVAGDAGRGSQCFIRAGQDQKIRNIQFSRTRSGRIGQYLEKKRLDYAVRLSRKLLCCSPPR